MKCANCGSQQVANYCAQCGQNDREYQRSLPPLVWELLKETFEIDSRIARTLKLLLFVPGELTAEFSRNRRAGYVSPFRLYLFINVLFFLLVSLATDVARQGFPEAVVIEAEQVTTDSDGQMLYQLITEDRHPQLDAVLARPDSSLSKTLLLEITREFTPELSGTNQAEEFASPLQRYMFSQLVAAVADPSRMIGDLVDNLPVMLFVILPVYAGLLSLMYRRRRRYYVENLVFVTHLQSFAFVIYSAIVLLDIVPELDSVLIVLLGVYHFAALKRYFRDGYLRTALKYVVQVLLYFLVLVPTSFFFVAVFTLAMV